MPPATGYRLLMRVLDLHSGLRSHSRYLVELECLRGLAILLVFFSHAHGMLFGNSPHASTWYLGFLMTGNTGVTLFFVLSGFLLSLPWLEQSAGLSSPAPHWRNFYRARLLRIVPLYAAAVLLATLLTGNWQAGLRALAFQFVGFEMFPYSVVWWTLVTEMQFYLVLPLAMWAWGRGGLPRAVLGGLLLAWLAAYSWWVLLQQAPVSARGFWLNKSLFGRLPAFLLGILAAWLWLNRSLWASPQWLASQRRWLSAALLCLLFYLLGRVLQVSAEMGDRIAEQTWHVRHTLEAILWTLIVLILLVARPLGRIALVNRPLAITGKLSYSIYLVHAPVLFYLLYPRREALVADGAGLPDILPWVFISLLVTCGLSWLTFRFIELPALRFKAGVPV